MHAPGHPTVQEASECYAVASHHRILKDGASQLASDTVADYNDWAQSRWGEAVAGRIGIGAARKFCQATKAPTILRPVFLLYTGEWRAAWLKAAPAA